MKLLLAEDDAILADALSSSLRNAGFEVEVAANGAVAEYLLLKQNFDVAVLDLGLPLVDGLTVLKRERAARPALPMLVLTALDGLDDRVAGLNAGADDYLTKPFGIGELLARLRLALRHRTPESANATLTAGELVVDLSRVLAGPSLETKGDRRKSSRHLRREKECGHRHGEHRIRSNVLSRSSPRTGRAEISTAVRETRRPSRRNQ